MPNYQAFLLYKRDRINAVCDRIMDLEQQLEDANKELAVAEDETFAEWSRDKAFAEAKEAKEA